MGKPKLFLDVDGVILAHYALPGQKPCFQMRPYVGSFISWASQHFDLFWLTCHGPDSTDLICKYNNVLQFNSLDDKNKAPETVRGITYCHWRDYSKEASDNTSLNLDKVQGIINVSSLSEDFLVIEDEYPCYDGYYLVHSQAKLKDKWIIVPKEGANIFPELQLVLEKYLLDKKLKLPWMQPEVDASAQLTGNKIFTLEVLNGLKKSI
jgi:hypothetical protein